MARVSIYVSDDLKARMAETGDALNWSDIARPAFETAIANHNHRKGRNMSTMVERLRASKAQHVQKQASDAKQKGRDWAANSAEYPDLKRISEADIDLISLGIYSAWKIIENATNIDESLDEEDLCSYLFGDDKSDRDEEWLIAWIEGAQEAFAEVEDQI